MKMLMAQRYNKLLAQMMDVNTGLQPRDLAEWDVDGDDMVRCRREREREQERQREREKERDRERGRERERATERERERER
jgi:hypothetical protein